MLRRSTIGITGTRERPPVVLDRSHPRVDRPKHVVSGGDGLTDAFSATAYRLGKGGQHRVQLGWVDLVQNVDKALKDRVDFGADVLGPQHRTSRNMLRAWIIRVDQVDVLGAENSGRADLRFCVGGNVADLAREQLQLQTNRVLSALNARDAAHLHTAHLDLGARFHSQSSAVRCQGDRHIGCERAGEMRPNTPTSIDDTIAIKTAVHHAGWIR